MERPRDWSQIIALRAAMRAFPSLVRQDREWFARYAFMPFRALALSWAARNIANFDVTASAAAASVAAHSAAVAARSAGGIKAAALADAASVAAEAAAATVSEAHAAEDVVTMAASTFSTSTAHFWRATSNDCDWLAKRAAKSTASRVMSRRSLWGGKPPLEWRKEWIDTSAKMLSIDPSYAVWIDWFDRRIRGERAAFDIPGDRGRSEDKAILVRLAEASDEHFWNKGAAHVNGALQGWIDDARARVDPAKKLVLDQAPILPSQAPHAVQFRRGSDGRIGIDTVALADTLRTDADARDRYAEAIAMAQAMLAGCEGSNAGARMTAIIEAYLIASGDDLESIRPSLFVQRGERLRQELAAYEAHDTMLAPLADSILLDATSWRSAHNMMVGLDPVLMALDTARLGPDIQPTILKPDEIRRMARSADAVGALMDGVAAVVMEAADLAPDIPDPTDRRTIWSSETAKNLVIEAFAVALNKPLRTVSGVAAFGYWGWAGAAIFGGALGAAKFLIDHRDWIEERMGNSPTWRGLFVQLCALLERNTPFGPMQSDDE